MESLDFCRFCNIVINCDLSGTNHNPLPIYDTVLCNTDNFLVVPACGCLVPGYIMIISKKHINSMAYLDKKEMNELIDLQSHLKIILSKNFNISPIIFEHGSALGCYNKSACCVEHAHWHIVPVKLSKEAMIIEKIQAKEIPDLQSIRNFKGEPYLLYFNHTGHVYISNSTVLPSQYMRKWIAEETGSPLEWDWRRYEFTDNIYSTISAFI